jgi:hypothetical protein
MPLCHLVFLGLLFHCRQPTDCPRQSQVLHHTSAYSLNAARPHIDSAWRCQVAAPRHPVQLLSSINCYRAPLTPLMSHGLSTRVRPQQGTAELLLAHNPIWLHSTSYSAAPWCRCPNCSVLVGDQDAVSPTVGVGIYRLETLLFVSAALWVSSTCCWTRRRDHVLATR